MENKRFAENDNITETSIEKFNNTEKGERAVVPLFSAVEKKCAFGAVRTERARKKAEIPEKEYESFSKKLGADVFYLRIYLLFFFLGAFLFSLEKWNVDVYTKDFLQKSLNDFKGLFDLSVGCFPLLWCNFALLVSGFTIYATPVTCGISSLVFFSGGAICGFVANEIIPFGGALGFLALVAVGAICFLFITFCCVTKGISNVVSHGVRHMSASDGVLYFLTFLLVSALEDGLFKAALAVIFNKGI